MNEFTRRRLGLLSVGALATAASGRAFGAEPEAFDPLPYVNPQLRPMAKSMLTMVRGMQGMAWNAQMLPMMRSGKSPFAPPGPLAQPAWSEQMIPGPVGAPDVRLFVINAGASGPPRPAILHMHGGGFILGSAKLGIRSLQETALALDCVIVTVDYRLAPETPFPGSLEDNYTGLRWLYANAAQLGVDRTRIAVMGESAGGGHAAMLAIAARDRGEIPLVYQALIYPMLDDRTGSTVKKPPYQGALMWTPEANRFGWSSLLGVPAGSAHTPDGAVPARVANLRALPPAFIGVGSIDLFVEEDIEYARRLVDAGVLVRLNVVPGGFHGFDMFPVPIAQAFRADLLVALREALRPVA